MRPHPIAKSASVTIRMRENGMRIL